MFIGAPSCTFKCEAECGIQCCQNSSLAHAKTIFVEDHDLISRYMKNPFTKAIVFGGLEPLDSFDELFSFCRLFRQVSTDPIIIYTG